MTSILLELAPELIVEILSYLDIYTVIACKSTCRTLNNIIASSVKLAYLYELQVAGMLDNPNCSYTTHPVTERLRLLRQREFNWDHLNYAWRKQETASVSSFYDFSAFGTYWAEHLERPHSVRFTQFPSSEGEFPLEWNSIDVGAEIIELATSADENDLLLAVVRVPTSGHENQVEIRLWSLSTRQPHPACKNHIIPVCTFSDDGSNDGIRVKISIEVSGDYLVIIVQRTKLSDHHNIAMFVGTVSPPTDMYIFDWKSGALLGQAPTTNLSALFLHKNLLLHPNLKSFTLDFYKLPSDPPASANTTLPLICSLELPPIHPYFNVFVSECRCEPSITKASPPHSSSNALAPAPLYIPSTRPFTIDPTEALFILSVEILDKRTIDNERFCFLSRRDILLDLVERATASNPEDPPTIPWPEWGPASTRMFPVDGRENPYITTTSGRRWAMKHNWAWYNEEWDDGMLNIPSLDPWKPYFQVYDFGKIQYKMEAKEKRPYTLPQGAPPALVWTKREWSNGDLYTMTSLLPEHGAPWSNKQGDGKTTGKGNQTWWFYGVRKSIVGRDRPSVFSSEADSDDDVVTMRPFVDDVRTELPFTRRTFVRMTVNSFVNDGREKKAVVNGPLCSGKTEMVRTPSGSGLQTSPSGSASVEFEAIDAVDYPGPVPHQWTVCGGEEDDLEEEDPGFVGELEVDATKGSLAEKWQGCVLDEERIIGIREGTEGPQPEDEVLDILYLG